MSRRSRTPRRAASGYARRAVLLPAVLFVVGLFVPDEVATALRWVASLLTAG